MSAERVLVVFLRVIGTAALLALPFVFIPFAWMDAIHAWLGMGPLEDRPIVGYLARSLSAMYAVQGGLAWVLSLDVRRFAPVIYFEAAVTILFGAVMLGVDFVEGMPLYWRCCEGPGVIAMGIALVVLVDRAKRDIQ